MSEKTAESREWRRAKDTQTARRSAVHLWAMGFGDSSRHEKVIAGVKSRVEAGRWLAGFIW